MDAKQHSIQDDFLTLRAVLETVYLGHPDDEGLVALRNIEEQLEALRETAKPLLRNATTEGHLYIDVMVLAADWHKFKAALDALSNPASVSEPETTVLNAGRPTTGSDSSPASGERVAAGESSSTSSQGANQSPEGSTPASEPDDGELPYSVGLPS